MGDQFVTVIVSSAISLISAFGSILLKDHLDQRREARMAGGALASSPNAAPSRKSGNASQSGPQAMSAPNRGRTAAVLIVIATIFAGLAIGLILNSVGSDGDPVALAALIATTFALLIFHLIKRRRSLTGYLLSSLTLWTAFFAGYSFDKPGGIGQTDTVLGVLAFWGLSAVIGLILFALMRFTRPRASPD